MTPKEALTLLDQATQPQNAGKITREGMCQVQVALETLAKTLEPPNIKDGEAGQTPAEAPESAA